MQGDYLFVLIWFSVDHIEIDMMTQWQWSNPDV